MINNSLRTILASGLLILSMCRSSGEDDETFQGIVELDEHSLAFEVGGTLQTLEVARGDRVVRGQLIASIDDSVERPTRDARQAELQAAEAQLGLLRAGSRFEEVRAVMAEARAAEATETLVEQSLARQRGLLQKGVAPSAQVEDLEAQLDRSRAQRQAAEQRLALVRRGARSQEIETAQARVDAARAALGAALARLARYHLHAPVAGTVLDVITEPGEVVSPAAPVLVVGDTTHPLADVFVPQGRLRGIRLGTSAVARVDGDQRPLRGRVEHISRRTEFTPRFLFSERERPNLVVRVRIRIEDPGERLHAGVPARVSLLRGNR